MQVPVQIVPPARLAEQNKGREPLAYLEIVGFPQLQAPSRLYPLATPFIPADKLEVPASSYRYTAADVRAIYDAKSEQCKRHMIARPAPGRSLPAEDSPAHPLPPQPELPPFPLPQPSIPLSGFPPPPYARTQQAPPRPSLPLSGSAPPPNARTQQALMQASNSSHSHEATCNKHSLPSQNSLTDLQPPHKVPKWAPSPHQRPIIPPPGLTPPPVPDPLRHFPPSPGIAQPAFPQPQPLNPYASGQQALVKAIGSLKQLLEPTRVSPAERSSSPRSSSHSQPSGLEESAAEPTDLP